MRDMCKVYICVFLDFGKDLQESNFFISSVNIHIV